MTYSERVLWNYLKNYQMMGYDLDRQKPILKYIVDFFCKDLMLAIEVDGITHFDDGDDASLRQKKIEDLGVSFLRFDGNLIVKDPMSVVRQIENWIIVHETTHPPSENVLKRRMR